ncbi:unnamed protein product [Brachionus calyciflorus]|uniref:Uncharacterized protein n=1 Tax=Brachionus calyciflorus TaxID=104777 RepID=A0A813SWS6_9BILA|nr:unnamed protein product [Brachionus calyciflorus]
MPEIKIKNEKSLNKYTDLMKNIINIQEKKAKLENEDRKVVANLLKTTSNLTKQLKNSSPSSFNQNSHLNKIKTPSLLNKKMAQKFTKVKDQPSKAILKNARSIENLKKIEHETRPLKKKENSNELRSKSAEFISATRRKIPNNFKTINWNDLQSLIHLHFSNQPGQNCPIPQSIQNELEKKFCEMKNEIDKLKLKLSAQKQVDSNDEKLEKKNHGEKNDVVEGLNVIISGYTDKLSHINKQVINFKNQESSKKIIPQNETKLNSSQNHKEIAETPFASNQSYINQLETELSAYKEKCKFLELSLEEKTKQVDEYLVHFKELSENVNMLISEIERKDEKNKENNQIQSISVNLTESKSINKILQNLEKFEKVLQVHQQESEASNTIKKNNLNIIKKNKDCSTTDTLIDADSSFAEFAESLKRSNFNSHEFNQQLNYFNKLNSNFPLPIINRGLANHYIQDRFSAFNKPAFLSENKNNFANFQSRALGVSTNLKNQFNAFYDDEDEEEKIVFSMEDLSITTIQTSNNTSESAESLLLLKNVQDDEFQKDLNILDEKILKVKKMIDSMKN